LMLDANYPWFVLVPETAGVREIYELPVMDQQQLMCESSTLGSALMKGFRGDKLNIAALGNIVPQLHVHHIVRYQNDPAWPGPVWGKVPVRPYDTDLQDTILAVLKQSLRDGIDYLV